MTIAFGAAGAVAPGTTSLSIAYPTGITAGQMLVMMICNKYPTNGPTNPGGGWFAPPGNQYSGGAGAAGVDTGTVYITCFLKIADGTETGSVTVTVTAGNACLGVIFRVTKTVGSWEYVCAGGSDNSAGTAFSVTAGSDPGVTAGDMIFVGSALNGNTDTATLEAIAQTGVTFGTMVERADSGTNNGDDCSIWVTEHPVNAGTGSAAPVYTATVGGTGSATAAGASLFLRLREVVKAPPPFHRRSFFWPRRGQ